MGCSNCERNTCSNFDRTTYDSIRSSFDDAAFIERTCTTPQRERELGIKECVDIDKPTTYNQRLDETKSPKGGAACLHGWEREPTSLDVYLHVRGFSDLRDPLYELGARRVHDLQYLDETDFESLGISKRTFMIQVDS